MWWDVDRQFSAVDLTGDPTAVASAELQAAIETMAWDELRILDDQLRELETYLNAIPHIEFRHATAETEAAFVDRPIHGEVVLTAPDEDDIFMFAAALNQQILASPVRWRLDLHENLCGIIESRLLQEPRAERLRRRFVALIRSLTLRCRALRRLREARRSRLSESDV